jgi:hypothetical protein
MLSDTDIHYIAGFLYVVSRSTDITVRLGDRVYDEASESRRDVDIIIATVGTTGLIGVEVKDESRPLDVSIVESLCQKFSDMPTITTRGIVSSSGYTKPAERKARAHGVECLTLVRGRLPHFSSISLSSFEGFSGTRLEWREGPSVSFTPDRELTMEQRTAIIATTPVLLGNGEIITPKVLADRVVAAFTASWEGPAVQAGRIPVAMDVVLEDKALFQLETDPFNMIGASVQGVVEWMPEPFRAEASCYLQTSDGSPYAGAVLTTMSTGLLGVAVSPQSQELRAFHVPDAIRNLRPTRVQIFPPESRTGA